MTTRITKRILGKTFFAALAFFGLSIGAVNAQMVCSIGSANYATLDDALAAVPDNTQTTIKLLTDITHDGGCSISNKTITFDLNGKNLIFTNTGGDALLLSYSAIDYTNLGVGCLQVKATDGNGLLASYSSCKLTYAEITITTASLYNAIRVMQNISVIVVNGNVKAIGSNAFGVSSLFGATTTVNGNVTADGNAVSGNVGNVIVNGNVTSTNGTGVIVSAGATASINGTITASNYISVDGTIKTASQYTIPTTKAGYLTYTYGTSTVWVKYYPVTNISGVPTTATIGTPLTLTGTVEPSNASFKDIVWTVANAGTTGAQIIGGKLFVTTQGTAVVMATIKDGTATGTDYTQGFYITASTTGIDDVETQNLKIYPNPVKDELIIESGELRIEKVEICDLTGKTIYQFDNLKNKIDVSALSQGIYIVKIKTAKGTVTEKFIKE